MELSTAVWSTSRSYSLYWSADYSSCSHIISL